MTNMVKKISFNRPLVVQTNNQWLYSAALYRDSRSDSANFTLWVNCKKENKTNISKLLTFEPQVFFKNLCLCFTDWLHNSHCDFRRVKYVVSRCSSKCITLCNMDFFFVKTCWRFVSLSTATTARCSPSECTTWWSRCSKWDLNILYFW